MIDWTVATALPTVWSCLAAHAAVLRLDGIRRRPLPAKLSGVFASEPATNDPLVFGVLSPVLTPHSRQNGLAEEDLVRGGYEILTRSRAAGVDAFVRREGALALLLQGHPEYDADTLACEYLRDVGRFLKGRRASHPRPPTGYFDAETESRLGALTADSRVGRDPARLAHYAGTVGRASLRHTWRASAVRLYRNWLAEIAAQARPPRWTAHSFLGPAA